MSEISELTVDELRALLQAKGLSTDGLKAELVERLAESRRSGNIMQSGMDEDKSMEMENSQEDGDMNALQQERSLSSTSESKQHAAEPERNLYVQGIGNMTENDLMAHFSTYGSVDRVKVMTNNQTGETLGFGFVVFSTIEEARMAIQGLNGANINGNEITVSVARRKEPKKQVVEVSVYVQGIPKNFSEDDVSKEFAMYGSVISVKLLTTQTGESRGIGFVKYTHRDDAVEAIRAMNGQVLNGGTDPLECRFARNRTQNNAFGYDPYSSNQRQGNNQYGAIRGYGSHGSFNRMPYPAQGQNSFGASPAANNGIVLFVYHVPMECSEEQLFQLFSLYGPVTRVNIVRDKNTGIMKGFAFVTMVNYPEAVNAVNNLNGYQMGHKRLKVSFKTDNKNQNNISNGAHSQTYGANQGFPQQQQSFNNTNSFQQF